MSKEGLKSLLEIYQVVENIKKWGLRSRTEIKNMLKVARRNFISIDFINNIPIRYDGRKKIDQTSKYIILDKGAYYVQHDWYIKGKIKLQ